MRPPDPPPPWLVRQRDDVGRRVRDARIWANLTQENLAERIGTGRQTVIRIELGVTDPPISRLLHIARVLHIPPAQLFPNDPGHE